MLGSFDEPPLPDMLFSPINIVPKPNNKWRLIHDLSFPWNGTDAINDCIPPEEARVQYQHIDEVIDIALRLGTETRGACVDIRHAFRNLPLRFDQLRYMGLSLNNKIYINSSVPFGAASSCLIFEKSARLIQWIVTNETSRSEISHYLDNFPLLATSVEDVQVFINQFIFILTKIGMPVAEDKTIGPTFCLEYLGLLLNFKLQVLEIPERKRLRCLELIMSMVDAYHGRHSVTIKTIQKLAGHLNFICQAIPAGKVFMAGLYSLLAPRNNERVRSGYNRRLNLQLRDDLLMFAGFLQELALQFNRSIPFMIHRNVEASEIQFYADSAGHPALGLGCTYNNRFAQGFWSDTTLFHGDRRPNIALLELLAIVIAFDIWAPEVHASVITLRSDNKATEGWITSKYSDIPAVMQLLRHLTRTCLLFQIHVKCVHIGTRENRP